MMRTLILAALPLLAACAAQTPPPPQTAAPGTRCDANAAQGLVGKSADAPSVARAKRLSGAGDVRRYRTGDALTMDFRADRLNIETDAAGTIVKLSCG